MDIFLSRFLSPCSIVCFVVHFDYFIIKKPCLGICGETTTCSSAMCDISLEREFNYMLYGMYSEDCLTKTSTTDVCVTLPPNFGQVRGYYTSNTTLQRVKRYKVLPYFFAVNTAFHFTSLINRDVL